MTGTRMSLHLDNEGVYITASAERSLSVFIRLLYQPGFCVRRPLLFNMLLRENTRKPTPYGEYEIILPLDDDDQQVNREDALVFINQVKVVFQDKMEKFYEFAQVLNDYKAQRVDCRGILARVKKLFKGHSDLVFRFNNFVPEEYQIKLDEQGHQLAIKDTFLNQVKVVFQDKMEKYFEFLEVVKDHNAQGIDRRGVAAIVKELFKGHTHLILGFNTYLPKEYQITPSFQVDSHETGDKVKKVAEIDKLPWDVLDIIFKILDFDDLFQFTGVCKNWRAFHKIYWKNFLTFHEPLLVKKSSHVMKSFSFINIANQKVYHSKMINYFWHYAYSRSSSGYLIMTGNNNSFLLMNPFTRRKKVINTSTFKVNFSNFAYHVLLAFGKGSEEFVLLALCKSSDSLHVYQSRNFSWVTYSRLGYPWMIVDFVVLHNTIYVVTNNANIGVLNLNSANIKFLELKNTPGVASSSHLRLVVCDEQLLMVNTMSKVVLIVYKINFSTMNYVKLKTLGDVALFYAPGGSYHALSNPNMWGYERNSVHVINHSATKCKVYIRDDDKLPKYVEDNTLRAPFIGRPYLLDWCFRHLHHYEVDYSIVE